MVLMNFADDLPGGGVLSVGGDRGKLFVEFFGY